MPKPAKAASGLVQTQTECAQATVPSSQHTSAPSLSSYQFPKAFSLHRRTSSSEAVMKGKAISTPRPMISDPIPWRNSPQFYPSSGKPVQRSTSIHRRNESGDVWEQLRTKGLVLKGNVLADESNKSSPSTSPFLLSNAKFGHTATSSQPSDISLYPDYEKQTKPLFHSYRIENARRESEQSFPTSCASDRQTDADSRSLTSDSECERIDFSKSAYSVPISIESKRVAGFWDEHVNPGFEFSPMASARHGTPSASIGQEEASSASTESTTRSIWLDDSDESFVAGRLSTDDSDTASSYSTDPSEPMSAAKEVIYKYRNPVENKLSQDRYEPALDILLDCYLSMDDAPKPILPTRSSNRSIATLSRQQGDNNNIICQQPIPSGQGDLTPRQVSNEFQATQARQSPVAALISSEPSTPRASSVRSNKSSLLKRATLSRTPPRSPTSSKLPRPVKEGKEGESELSREQIQHTRSSSFGRWFIFQKP